MTAAVLGAFVVRGRGRVLDDGVACPHLETAWHTPVVQVRGRSWLRWSIAVMCCYRPGEVPRLIYRPRDTASPGAKDATPLPGAATGDLLVRAHLQLKPPVVLAWDGSPDSANAVSTRAI